MKASVKVTRPLDDGEIEVVLGEEKEVDIEAVHALRACAIAVIDEALRERKMRKRRRFVALMPILRLRERCGDVDLLLLLDRLREQALNGYLRVWGRRAGIDGIDEGTPLEEIDRKVWRDFVVDVGTFEKASTNGDIYAYSRSAPRSVRFDDIHVEALRAKLWLWWNRRSLLSS